MAEKTQFVPERLETSRRAFLKICTAAFAAFPTLALAVPFVGALIGPSLRMRKAHWTRVGPLGSLTEGPPLSFSFNDRVEDAFVRETAERSVWVVKLPGEGLRVYSPICTHLGCHYDWHGQSGHFVCPCHGSVFALDGTVLGGPAPRPLDILPMRVESGVLYVEWERFESGTAKKVRV
jgi:quinol---cytochrome c reductase iron-sulfur subunit, bacillus type